MARKYYKEESKKNYWTDAQDGISNDSLKTGCLMRIADATELMAKNYTELQADHDYYKKFYNARGERISALLRSIASYRGQITKLKKALAATKPGVVILDGILND